ncbi:MAG: type II secretion system protein GspC [Pseudomonadota bacterium]
MSSFSEAMQTGVAQLNRNPMVAKVVANGPAIAMLVLTIMIAWKLAGLVWSFFPERIDSPISGAPKSVATASSDGDAGGTVVDVTPVVNAHLFGIAGEEPDKVDDGPPPCIDPEDCKEFEETSEPLILRGTLAADSETNAIAIIAEGREENVFTIGDTVKRGIRLHAVQTTKVILNNNGKLESLSLPEQESAPSRAPVQRVSRQRAVSGSPSISQVLTNNASSLTQIIQPRPYFVGGRQRGYRLYPGRDRQRFSQLGLRPGDIVTEINGTPLTNPTEGAKIFTALGDAQSITVTLERNGSPQQLTLDVSQLDVGQTDQ